MLMEIRIIEVKIKEAVIKGDGLSPILPMQSINQK
jgi:hypothetical protein